MNFEETEELLEEAIANSEISTSSRNTPQPAGNVVSIAYKKGLLPNDIESYLYILAELLDLVERKTK